MAAVVSRVTGLARTLVLAGVLGVSAVADAYNGANSFPNMVYELLLGGVLSSVFVPWLVRAQLRGPSLSLQFTQRLLGAGALALGVVTVLAVAAAPLLARLIVADDAQRHLTTMFAYLLLPEIFFYGIAAMLTAVLNVHDRFSMAAWAPVINNVIVVLTAGLFVLAPGSVTLTPSSMTSTQVLILGVGTSAGIVAQAVWVAVALRRTGFRWSWRVRLVPYTWRPVRVGAAVIGWVVAYALISQVGVAVALRVAFVNGGVSVYTYADLLFQVPYGVLGVTLLTVLMPRISRAVAQSDTSAILADLGRGARYSIVALVPVTAAVIILAPALAKVMFLGRVDVAGAAQIGTTAAAAAFGLAPFALVMLQMRVFYAANDSRTPALINLAMVVTKVGAILIAAATLPPYAVVVMLGVASSLSFLVGAGLAHFLLRRRYGLLGFYLVAETLRRVGTAATIAGGCCLAVVFFANAFVSEPRRAALLALILGTAVGLTTFHLSAKAIGIPELRNARALLMT